MFVKKRFNIETICIVIEKVHTVQQKRRMNTIVHIANSNVLLRMIWFGILEMIIIRQDVKVSSVYGNSISN